MLQPRGPTSSQDRTPARVSKLQASLGDVEEGDKVVNTMPVSGCGGGWAGEVEEVTVGRGRERGTGQCGVAGMTAAACVARAWELDSLP